MKRFEMRVNAEASKPGAVLTVDEVLMELVDALQVMTLTGDKGPAEVALDLLAVDDADAEGVMVQICAVAAKLVGAGWKVEFVLGPKFFALAQALRIDNGDTIKTKRA